MVVDEFSLDCGIGPMFRVVHFILIRVFGNHSGVPHGYVLYGTTVVVKQLKGMFIGLIPHMNNIMNNFVLCD